MAQSKEHERLTKKRSCLKSKLTIFNNFISLLKTCTEPSQEQYLDLEGRLNKFDAIYPIFDDLQSDIEMLTEDSDAEMKEREQFEDQYHKLAAAARGLLSARRCQQRDNGSVSGNDDVQASNSHLHNCVQLPKIDLPIFHGNYQHWLKFRDTFISLIHSRQDMDNINKLHYLHASLKGSALLIIDNLDFKADNYEAAWKLLCNRYDNKRLLVNNHVQALFNIERMQKESFTSIRHLIDVTNKNLRALASLDQPTQHWDTLVIHMISEKLDSVTYRVWEEHRNTLSDSPSLKIFIQFLSNRADLLETIQEKGNMHNNNSYKQNTYFLTQNTNNNKNSTYPNNNKSNNNQNIKSNQNNYNQKSFKCSLCNESHYLFNCETFRSLSVEERIKKAKETKVCLNCLRPGHYEIKCTLVPCRYCKKRHNTLLHLHEPEPTPITAIPVNVNHFANDSNGLTQFTTPAHVLLSTAIVRVLDGSGAAHSARLLLDNGSTANIVTQSLCGKLGLSRRDAYSMVTEL
ncbi:defective in tip formation protein A-like isoform X1 [Ostrinia nubilalis]|uniref:defective in tip formation protein A-like isoform X1 n=1 Tax=Ostrinia nubilalis TaxID=29057 RepID=UPI0030826B3A